MAPLRPSVRYVVGPSNEIKIWTIAAGTILQKSGPAFKKMAGLNQAVWHQALHQASTRKALQFDRVIATKYNFWWRIKTKEAFSNSLEATANQLDYCMLSLGSLDGQTLALRQQNLVFELVSQSRAAHSTFRAIRATCAEGNHVKPHVVKPGWIEGTTFHTDREPRASSSLVVFLRYSSSLNSISKS